MPEGFYRASSGGCLSPHGFPLTHYGNDIKIKPRLCRSGSTPRLSNMRVGLNPDLQEFKKDCHPDPPQAEKDLGKGMFVIPWRCAMYFSLEEKYQKNRPS